MPAFPDDLARTLRFVAEIDKLKTVVRKTELLDRSRNETSAEHSWQLALMAVSCAQYANQPVDVLKVVKMALIHDIVEIDAGDLFLYATPEQEEAQHAKEVEAADRIFGLLPDDIGGELRLLWDEFEARESTEARFARALDRFQPLYHNFLTEGGSWREFGVSAEQVLQRNALIADGSEVMAKAARDMIAEALEKGHILAEAGPADG